MYQWSELAAISRHLQERMLKNIYQHVKTEDTRTGTYTKHLFCGWSLGRIHNGTFFNEVFQLLTHGAWVFVWRPSFRTYHELCLVEYNKLSTTSGKQISLNLGWGQLIVGWVGFEHFKSGYAFGIVGINKLMSFESKKANSKKAHAPTPQTSALQS